MDGNDVASGCAGGEERREYKAVDRASKFERLTRARSEAGRGPACMPRWRRAREKERPSMERRKERPLHTQPLTPPEFRNSGAQTRPCPTNHRVLQLVSFVVGRECSNRSESKSFIRYPRLFHVMNNRSNLSSLYVDNIDNILFSLMI